MRPIPILLALLALPCLALAQVQLGIDVLASNGYDLLRGKRVGLVTNQTGVNRSGIKTRILLKKNVNLVALYTPEHGLDGTEKAGKYVRTRTDSVTGVVAYSLYGETRKPTPAMLEPIDVLVYDMQDIGCRSYTYISTMARCLQACAENGKEFIVLDRPNPLGGNRVEGMPIESKWISFVGQLPVPYVHGMTVGELALMTNARGWMTPTKCDLKIVKMRGWDRRMAWTDTGLRWVQTSPNIPNAMSPFYYVTTGVAGSLGGGFDIGIGSIPFEKISAGWMNGTRMTAFLNSGKFRGIEFDKLSNGTRLRISPHADGDLAALALYILWEANKQSNGRIFARSSASQLDIFYKVYGSDRIRADLNKRSAAEIVASWRPFVEGFRRDRQAYLLY